MNLTEASFKELYILKSCIEEKVKDLQSKKERAESYLKPDDDDSASEVLTEIVSLVNEELEPLQTWLVQVLNAMKIVSK